ncbi:hypothetical protein OH781_31600 [Streptomyces sp. NBC_01550]
MENRSSALLKTAVLLNGGDRHAAAEDLLKNALTANEEYVHWFNDAGLSPDGKLVAGDYAGDNKKSASSSSTSTPASGSLR